MEAGTYAWRSLGKLYGWWVLLSTIGWAAGPILLLVRMGRGVDALGTGLAIVLYGLIVGLAQWLVLRRKIPRAGWWVLATTASVALGVAFLWIGVWLTDLLLEPGRPSALPSTDDSRLVIAIFGGLCGLVLGAAAGLGQSKVLPWHITDVGWWALASTVGGVLDGALVGNLLWGLGGVSLVEAALRPGTSFFAAAGTGLLAAMVGPCKGIVTGAVLVWLVKTRPL